MDFAKFIHQYIKWNIVLEIFFVDIDIVKITFSDEIWKSYSREVKTILETIGQEHVFSLHMCFPYFHDVRCEIHSLSCVIDKISS